MKLTKTPISATIRPKRMIGEFHADITLEEAATDTLQITEHPVQQGASITDHAYVKPASITIKTVFRAEEAALSEVYEKLLTLQSSRIPIDVVTSNRIYKNMLLQSLSQTTNKSSENVLAIDFTLREVIFTSVEVVSVPEREKQREPRKTSATRNAGQRKSEEASPEVEAKVETEAHQAETVEPQPEARTSSTTLEDYFNQGEADYPSQ